MLEIMYMKMGGFLVWGKEVNIYREGERVKIILSMLEKL